MKKMIPRAHLEIRQGTIDQAIKYCVKEGDYEEFGKKPMSQQEKGNENKKRWRLINEKAKEGDEAWLEEHEPHVYHTQLATFRSHKKPKTTPLDYIDTRMSGGSGRREPESPKESGTFTPPTMLKRRTSGGATTRTRHGRK